MKLVWTPEAERDLEEIIDYIGFDDPGAAARMHMIFERAVSRLPELPQLGRPGMIEGTRELIPHSSYRLVYEVREQSIWVVALVHTSRQWPPVSEDE